METLAAEPLVFWSVIGNETYAYLLHERMRLRFGPGPEVLFRVCAGMAEAGELLEIEARKSSVQPPAAVLVSEFLFTESADDLIPVVNRLFPKVPIFLLPDSSSISVERLAGWHQTHILKADDEASVIAAADKIVSVVNAGRPLPGTEIRPAEKESNRFRVEAFTQLIRPGTSVEDVLKTIFKMTGNPDALYYLTSEQGKLKLNAFCSNEDTLPLMPGTDFYEALNKKTLTLLTETLEALENDRPANEQTLAEPLHRNGKLNGYLLADNRTSGKKFGPEQKQILENAGIFLAIHGEMNRLSDRLAERTRLLAGQKDKEEEQKMVIELIEKELEDQIRFAHSLQESSFKLGYEFLDLFSESFLIFQPAKLVSSAGYWFRERYHRSLIACADTNEPGVSAAFLSLVTGYLLDEITEQNALHTPDEILALLNLRLRRWFKVHPQVHTPPLHLSIGLCSIDHPNNELLYAGAGHRLFILRNGEAFLSDGDSEPLLVNDAFNQTRSLELHRINLEPGDVIYLFSRSWTLLFNRSRVNSDPAALIKTLNEMSHLSLPEQEKAFRSTVEHWKKDDRLPFDLLLMAVKWSE